MGYPKWMVDFMGKSHYNGWWLGVPPIYRNPHISAQFFEMETCGDKPSLGLFDNRLPPSPVHDYELPSLTFPYFVTLNSHLGSIPIFGHTHRDFPKEQWRLDLGKKEERRATDWSKGVFFKEMLPSTSETDMRSMNNQKANICQHVVENVGLTSHAELAKTWENWMRA